MRSKTITVGGIRYYIDTLDLDRLYANLVALTEESTDLWAHSLRHPDEPEWEAKARAVDADIADLRELIAVKRGG